MAEESVDIRVVVIESPSPDDLLDDRHEGKILVRSLRLFGIWSELRLVVDFESLLRCMREDIGKLITEGACIPIIHLSGHGNQQGFALTDRTLLTWEMLSKAFRAINQAVDGRLIVCLSCCEGFKASHCALFSDPLPFASLVGHTAGPSWADTAVAFSSFYHLLRKGRGIKDAVDGMRAACGNNDFRVIQGTDIVSLREQIAACGGIDGVLEALSRLEQQRASASV